MKKRKILTASLVRFVLLPASLMAFFACTNAAIAQEPQEDLDPNKVIPDIIENSPVTYAGTLCNTGFPFTPGTGIPGSTSFRNINVPATWEYYNFFGTVGDLLTIEVHRTTNEMDPAIQICFGTTNDSAGVLPFTLAGGSCGPQMGPAIGFADDNNSIPHGVGGLFQDPRMQVVLPLSGEYTLMVYDYIGLGPSPKFEIHVDGLTGGDCAPPDVCINFDGASGGPLSYTESGMTVTSLYPSAAHLHLGGGVLLNHSSCCSTPYLFDFGGTPFTVLSIDVPSFSGSGTFTSSDGDIVTPTGTGTIVFPVTGWTDITDFRWDQPSGSMTIDNICVAFGPTNEPPVCDAGADQTLQCLGELTTVILDGSNSSDPDGDPLEFQWSVPIGSAATVLDPDSAVTTGDFPIGPTMVTLTVSDPFGGVAVCDVVITIFDDLPPVIVCTTNIATLWPPRHNMVEVFLTVVASDVCWAPEDLIVNCTVSSSEPDDANGDGEFTGDVDGFDGFVAPVPVSLSYNVATESWDGSILLRAERDGRQSGRTYSIVCDVVDPESNLSTSSCVVMVPHDRRGGGGNNN